MAMTSHLIGGELVFPLAVFLTGCIGVATEGVAPRPLRNQRVACGHGLPLASVDGPGVGRNGPSPQDRADSVGGVKEELRGPSRDAVHNASTDVFNESLVAVRHVATVEGKGLADVGGGREDGARQTGVKRRHHGLGFLTNQSVFGIGVGFIFLFCQFLRHGPCKISIVIEGLANFLQGI